jgi:hypothetical protein
VTLPATLYECAHVVAPVRVDTFASFDELCEALTDLVNVEAPAKDRCPYWGPYALADGATRADANVPALSCLVTDLDAVHDVGALIASLEGTEAFVYESPSSTDDAPRVRIVTPTTRPIARTECAHTRLAFAEALGLAPGCGADGVLPASIGFYAGRVAGTRARRTWRTHGAPVDVARLLATPLVHAWGKRAANREPRERTEAPRDAVEPSYSDRVFELAARIVPRWLAGDRETDNFERAFYGWLRGCGWSRAEVAGLVNVLDDTEPDAAKRREHAKKAREAAPLSGPSDAVRAWFGDEWTWVDAHATAARREWWARREARRIAERAAARAETPLDTMFGRRYTFDAPEEPLVYHCPGLSLARSDGKITIIGGDPGGGKGPLADHLAVCFAFGLPAFGHEPFACARVKVLLLDCEGRRLTMRRTRRMARAMGRNPEELDEALHVFDASSAELHEPTVQSELARYVHENDISVVVLDSYTSAMLASGLEANAPEFAMLAKALGALDRLVIAVGHANKAAHGAEPTLAGIAYSGAFAAMAQTAIVLSYPDKRDKHTVRVACARAPEDAFKPFLVRFENIADDGLRLTYAPIAEKTDAPKEPRVTARSIESERKARDARRRIEEYMKTHGTAFESRAELLSVGGEGAAAGETALARLVEEKLLVRVHGGFTRAR